MSTSPNLGPEYFTLLGIFVGVSITFMGNWVLAKRHARLEFQRALFLRKLEIYEKLTELLWPMGVKQHRKGISEEKAAPRPYDSNKELSKWINSITDFVSSKRLLLDEKTLEHFGHLNELVMSDLHKIAGSSMPDTVDEVTREVGLNSADTVHSTCTDIHNAGWLYFKRTYKVEL